MRSKYLVTFGDFDGTIRIYEINIHFSEYDNTYSASDLGDNLNNNGQKVLGCGKDSPDVYSAIKSLLAGRILANYEKLGRPVFSRA